MWQRRAEMQSEISVGHTVCGHYWVTDVSRCVCVCEDKHPDTEKPHGGNCAAIVYLADASVYYTLQHLSRFGLAEQMPPGVPV